MRCFFRPIAGNDRIVDPTLFTGILSRDLAGRINWGKTLYDLNRLEQMILFHLAGDFFGIDEGS